MATSNIPTRDQVITDIDSPEIHDVPQRDLEPLNKSEQQDIENEEDIERGDVKDSHDR
jgi:hypothetical protein